MWTKEEEATLKSLRSQNILLYTEIAKKMGKPVTCVRWKAKKLGLPSTQKTLDKFGKWNTKHSHLRESVMKYFLTHTMNETRKRFRLTKSEARSLFTVGYRMPEFKHLRKETRDHSTWSTKQLKFLLRHAGLMPRKWVADKIGRGNEVCIKERMQKLGISSRGLQGITLSQFRKAFEKEPEFYIQTQAGPNGGSSASLPTRWKIVPWVWLDQEFKAKRLLAPKEVKLYISIMAMFQDWIFEGNSIRKMQRISKTEIG